VDRPLSNGGTNERSNLQALCPSCHLEKTQEEKQACEHIYIDNFTSAFNTQANDIMNSDHFKKIAHTQHLKHQDTDL
jgi:hypothetical protein